MPISITGSFSNYVAPRFAIQKEVRIRQIFLHTPLNDEEQAWLVEFREFCRTNDFKIPLFLEPMLLRIIWLAYRKWGDNIMSRRY